MPSCNCGAPMSDWEGATRGVCYACAAEARTERQRAFLKERQSYLLESSGVPDGCLQMTWSHWDGPRPAIDPAKTLTLIYGPVGRGKTHAATAMMADWLVRGGRAYWTTCAELVNAVSREGWDTHYAIQAAEDTPLLILDDFPPDHINGYRLGMLTALIMQRYNQQKKTIVTTNLSLEKLDELSARLLSRFADGNLIELSQGQDRRKE